MPNPYTTTGAVRDFAADESASRFALIIEATTDVVAMADKTGRLLYVNTAGRKLLGLDPESDISGFSLSNLHPDWALEINRTALTYHNVPVELRKSLVNTARHEYFSELGKSGS